MTRDLEWLSQIYGEQNERPVGKSDNINEKRESSTVSAAADGFNVHDLACFR